MSGQAIVVLGLPSGVTACLFDLDGVLTDTASVHLAAWKAAFGPDFTDDDYERYVDGKPRDDGIRSYLAARGSEVTDEVVRRVGEHKNAVLQDMLRRDGVTVYAGSRRYLEACRDAGIRRAVVSSSANTALVLEVTGLDALVEHRVDGVTARARGLAGKPAPDTFLAATVDLGLLPEQAAVFEDALAGVEAGRAGGFGLVVGVDRVGHGDHLRTHGADVVVTDLEQLL